MYNTNWEEIGDQFPILKTKISDKDLIYLDNAATTQKPKAVLDALADYYLHYNANIHGGIHKLSQESGIMWENAHKVVADFINASEDEIAFVRNSTEGLNLLAHCLKSQLSQGDVVAITEAEHHSNILPWKSVAAEHGGEIVWVPVKDDYTLDYEFLSELVEKYKERLKLLAVTHISNVTGVENDIWKCSNLLHKYGGLVVVDAAQSIAHTQVDVRDLDCDFLVFSGHKIFAPNGAGVVYGKREYISRFDPFMVGGGTITDVTKDVVEYAEIPMRLEAGTPDIADGIVLAVALLWLQHEVAESRSASIQDILNYEQSDIDVKSVMNAIEMHEREIMKYAAEKLKSIPEVKIFGPVEKRYGALSFTVDNIHPHDIASVLNEEGIAIRAGMHCAHPLHYRFNLNSTARCSISLYNNRNDIDAFVASLNKVIGIFK